MGNDTIKSILITFGDVMRQNHIIQWILNWCGWYIILLLKYIVDSAEFLLDQVYSINDFIFSDPVQDYINAYQPILWILFAIGFMILGWTLITDHERQPKIFQNFLISLLVLTALPVMIVNVTAWTMQITEFSQMNTSVADSFSAGEETALSVSESIIISNTTDLLWCHDAGWENLRDFNTGENLRPRPWNNLKTLDGFDINEKIWSHDSSRYYYSYDEFKYYLTQDTDGILSLEAIEDSWWGLLIHDYSRYHVDWFPTVLTLFFTALALLFAAYKVARLIWELAVHQFLAMLFAAGDFTSGQRLKEILKSMASIFITIFLVSVMLKFFLIGVSYLQTQAQMNGFVKAMIIVFFALAAIDAPNIIERILGVDAGLRSVLHTGFAAARGFGNIKHKVTGAGRKAASAAAGAAGKQGTIRNWAQRNVGKSKDERSIHKNQRDTQNTQTGSSGTNSNEHAKTADPQNSETSQAQKENEGSPVNNRSEEANNSVHTNKENRHAEEKETNGGIHHGKDGFKSSSRTVGRNVNKGKSYDNMRAGNSEQSIHTKPNIFGNQNKAVEKNTEKQNTHGGRPVRPENNVVNNNKKAEDVGRKPDIFGNQNKLTEKNIEKQNTHGSRPVRPENNAVNNNKKAEDVGRKPDIFGNGNQKNK